MAIDTMKAKVEIADQLTDMALEVWKYAKENRENIRINRSRNLQCYCRPSQS